MENSYLLPSSVREISNEPTMDGIGQKAVCDRIDRMNEKIDKSTLKIFNDLKICKLCGKDMENRVESEIVKSIEAYNKIQAYLSSLTVPSRSDQIFTNQNKGKIRQSSNGKKHNSVAIAKNLNKKRHDLLCEINMQHIEASQLRLHHACLNDTLKVNISISNTARAEILHLQQCNNYDFKSTAKKSNSNIHPLFDNLEELFQGSSLQATVHPLFDRLVFNSNTFAVVNGSRLSYQTISQHNLNWLEINRSWSTVCTLLLCLRNLYHLAHIIDPFCVFDSKIAELFRPNIASAIAKSTSKRKEKFLQKLTPEIRFFLSVRPLPGRASILLTRVTLHSNGGKASSKASENTLDKTSDSETRNSVEEFLFHLEGGIQPDRKESVNIDFIRSESVTKSLEVKTKKSSPRSKNVLQFIAEFTKRSQDFSDTVHATHRQRGKPFHIDSLYDKSVQLFAVAVASTILQLHQDSLRKTLHFQSIVSSGATDQSAASHREAIKNWLANKCCGMVRIVALALLCGVPCFLDDGILLGKFFQSNSTHNDVGMVMVEEADDLDDLVFAHLAALFKEFDDQNAQTKSECKSYTTKMTFSQLVFDSCQSLNKCF